MSCWPRMAPICSIWPAIVQAWLESARAGPISIGGGDWRGSNWMFHFSICTEGFTSGGYLDSRVCLGVTLLTQTSFGYWSCGKWSHHRTNKQHQVLLHLTAAALDFGFHYPDSKSCIMWAPDSLGNACGLLEYWKSGGLENQEWWRGVIPGALQWRAPSVNTLQKPHFRATDTWSIIHCGLCLPIECIKFQIY